MRLSSKYYLILAFVSLTISAGFYGCNQPEQKKAAMNIDSAILPPRVTICCGATFAIGFWRPPNQRQKMIPRNNA